MSAIRSRVTRLLLFSLIVSVIFSIAIVQAAYAETGDVTAGTTTGEAGQIIAKGPVDDGVYNIVSFSEKSCSLSVKDNSTKAKAAIALFATQRTSWAQKWIAVFDGATGYYTLRNLGSRMALSVSGQVKAGAAVKQMKPSSSLKQRWVLTKSGSTIVLRSAANPALALSVAGTKGGASSLKLKRLAASGAGISPTKSQRFKFKQVDAIDDGFSFFVRSAKTGKAMSVPKDSRKNGAKLALEKKKSARNQKFRFIKSGKSNYLIQCVSSCKYVGVKGAGLRQYASKGGKAKKWNVELDLKSGTFILSSAQSAAKQLDAASGKLSMRTASNTATQRFVLLQTYGFKLYLDPGHGRSGGVYDPGAEGNGREEADLTKDLASRIEKKLAGTDIEVVNGGKFGLAYWRRAPKAAALNCDAILSVHFDTDGGGGSTSTMVGTRGPLSKSNAFNSIIHKSLVSSTGLRDGGTMHRGDITIVNGRVPSVLMEVCFIDDYSSLRKYLNRRNVIASSLAKGVIKASRAAEVQR